MILAGKIDMKKIFFIMILLGCGHLHAGDRPSYQSSYSSKTKSSTTIKYGYKSYSTRFSNGAKVNSSPYGAGVINRYYKPNGTLQRSTIVRPFGSGWIER